MQREGLHPLQLLAGARDRHRPIGADVDVLSAREPVREQTLFPRIALQCADVQHFHADHDDQALAAGSACGEPLLLDDLALHGVTL